MLKHGFLIAALLLTQLLVDTGAANGQSEAAPTSADTDNVEKAIRAGADAFVAAFAKRDAEAIAAGWTADGVYVDEAGQKFEGRKSIQSEYESMFKDCGDDLAIQLEIDSVRLVNANTAIEAVDPVRNLPRARRRSRPMRASS